MTICNESIENLTAAINTATGFLEQLSNTKNNFSRFSMSGVERRNEHISKINLNDVLENCVISGLLKDDSISDILINGPFEIYVDRYGNLEKTDIKFDSHVELLQLAEAITSSINKRIDPRRPLIDARLPDGSRVNIVAPPMSVDGLSISIRKFSKNHITLDTLEEYQSITSQMNGFLQAAAICKLNIIISGGTGTGKTTLLNAISQYIPPSERIVSIEDSIELRLQQPHVVRLESKSPEIIGDRSTEVNIRDLVTNALRMRPDRIIVGEVRGEEAYDMIQAMNTGHDGSITTVHANTPRDALARLENMIGQIASPPPTAIIRKQVVSALNLIIQITRQDDGKRKITTISEIVGMEGETPVIQEIFSTKQVRGLDGKLNIKQEWSGIFPRHAKLTEYLKSNNILKNI